MSVTKGVLGAPTLESASLPAPLPAAPPRAVLTAANQAPSITEVDWAPRNDDTVPPGVDATVDVEHFLTLKVRAGDPDGDPLYCTWEVDDGATARQQHRMEWEDGGWESVVEWSPPPGATPGDRFTLTCTVEDRRGGSDHSQLGVSGVVETIIKGKVVFASNRNGNWDLYLVNIDGTELRNLTNTVGVDEHNPRMSPDGTRIIFQRGTVITNPGRNDEVWIANRDGSGPRSLTGAPPANHFYAGASFSPDGTRICYVESLEGGGETYMMANVDGSAPITVVPYSDKTPLPIFTPDGQGLISAMTYPNPINPGTQRRLVHIDLSSGPISFATIPPVGVTPLVNFTGHHDPQSFSPDGTELLFTSRVGDDYTQYKIPFDPNGPLLPVTHSPVQVSVAEQAAWASRRAGHYLSENLVVKDQNFAGNWEIVKTDPERRSPRTPHQSSRQRSEPGRLEPVKKGAGVSLMEMVFSMFILVTAFVSAVLLLQHSFEINRISEARTAGVLAAQNVVARVKAWSKADGGGRPNFYSSWGPYDDDAYQVGRFQVRVQVQVVGSHALQPLLGSRNPVWGGLVAGCPRRHCR